MESVEAFRESFIGRLQALANAHGLLLATQWHSADMRQLVETALSAYETARGDAIRVGGPVVQLKPKQGLGLSLILHELSTNAAKYGALSCPEGRLDISWIVEREDDCDFVHMRWIERGGPPVESIRRKGFGSRFVERACQFELGGDVELKFPSEGCEIELRFPVT